MSAQTSTIAPRRANDITLENKSASGAFCVLALDTPAFIEVSSVFMATIEYAQDRIGFRD